MKKNNGPDFLVVGMEKSGTHWVTALLNAHPEVSCFPVLPFYSESGGFNTHIVGEVHLFNTLASLEDKTENKFTRPLENYIYKHNKIFADLVPYKNKVSKQELYKMFIQRYNELCDSQIQDKRLVGESTPAYIFHLDFIDSFYPAIKKICIIRDPKDKIVSWHFNEIRKGRKTDMAITDQFALDYLDKRIIKEYQALLDYNRPIHCLTYEGLSNYTKEVVVDMLKYLEVEINDQIINNMIEQGSFKKLNATDSKTTGRERGQQSLNSQYRKGIVGDWKNYLTLKQAEMIDQKISKLRKKVFNKYQISFN